MCSKMSIIISIPVTLSELALHLFHPFSERNTEGFVNKHAPTYSVRCEKIVSARVHSVLPSVSVFREQNMEWLRKQVWQENGSALLVWNEGFLSQVLSHGTYPLGIE